MLPLGLLKATQGHPVLVELKNGETVNGHLVDCDTWMNLTLKEVVLTSPDGDKFWRLPDIYVRGNNIKYLRVPDEIIDIVKEQQSTQQLSFEMWPVLRNFLQSIEKLKAPSTLMHNVMPTAQLLCDGLWRCLCPSFNPNFLSRSLQPLKSRPGRLRPSARLQTLCLRYSSTSASQSTDYQLRFVEPVTERSAVQGRKSELSSTEAGRRGYEERRLIRHYDYESGFEERSLVRRYGFGEETTSQETSIPSHWFDTPTTELYDELRTFAAQGKVDKVKGLSQYLLKHRQEAPNLRLYGALILANADALTGSAAMVGMLLQEMRQEQLEWDSGICHDALKALAVHSDYLLRAEILEHMRQRWFSFTMAGHHDVAAGLLREQQFELALDRLDIMAREGVHIQPWLFDMAIYMLNEAGEIDEALRLIKYRIGTGEITISADVWYHLLDAASSLLHYEATLYVWKKRVQPSYLNPPSGMCLNILSVAARQGDAQLATDVFRVLGNRNTVFEHQHYELLIDTYINSGDLNTALSVLCVMEAVSTAPDEGTTRTLFKYLSKDAHRPMQVFDMLRSLQASGRTVPTAALNCVIEASLHFRFLEQAIEQYKALHAICAAGPNTATFNVLLRGCVKNKRKDLAMFLASEMLALKVKPDALTYDRLMLVCLSEVDHEDAMLYYYEMKGQSWMPRQGTLSLLVKRAAAAEDPRAWEVVADMEKAGIGTAILRMWLEDNWGVEEAEWSSSSQVRRSVRPPPVHDVRRPVDFASMQP